MIGQLIRGFGGVASRAHLVDKGVDDALIARAVRSGEIVRLRRGWFAVPSVDEGVARAVAVGGRLTCGPALARRGVWCFDDGLVHVGITPRGRKLGDACFHSARLSAPRGPDLGTESVLAALERLATCAPRIGFLVAADSALNKRMVTLRQLERVIGETTRGRRLLSAVDGRSESGIETIARVALRRQRVQLRPQVEIPGIGRVDLIVGDRMVVECDGWTWHRDRDAFEDDRARDLALTARGYLPVRLGSLRILHEWSQIESDLVTLVQRREHYWRARHRKLGHQPHGGYNVD